MHEFVQTLGIAGGRKSPQPRFSVTAILRTRALPLYSACNGKINSPLRGQFIKIMMAGILVQANGKMGPSSKSLSGFTINART